MLVPILSAIDGNTFVQLRLNVVNLEYLTIYICEINTAAKKECMKGRETEKITKKLK